MCSSAQQEEPPTPLKGENMFKHLRRDNDDSPTTHRICDKSMENQNSVFANVHLKDIRFHY